MAISHPNQDQKFEDEMLESNEESAPEESYDLHENIGFLLRIANQCAVSRFNQHLASVLEIDNVTTAQFAVLTTLWRFPKSTFSSLSEFTSIDMPTLNSMINRLEKRGLLGVIINPKDKRSRLITLTPAGNQLTQKLNERGNQIGEFIARNLNESELRRLKILLRKFLGNAVRR